MSLVHKNIRIYGKVQGVFFRASTQQIADQLGIRGTVKNEADNSVSIEAEGEEETIKKFIEWCKKGPPAAQVATTDISDGQITGYKSFEIIH